MQQREKLFRLWVSEHERILLHVASGFADGADRDDLLQEILLGLWQALPAFRGDAKPATFIYRVAQNVALTRWRRNARQPVPQSLDDIAAEPAAPEPARYERSEQLYAAIRRLPATDSALLLMHLDDCSYRVIADALGISESNVGVRLTRLRHRLSRMMEESKHEND